MRMRGLGRVYQPTYRERTTGTRRFSPTWWIAYSYHGKKYRESSESTKRGDAVKLLRRRLEETGQGQIIGPDARRLSFEGLASLVTNDYKTNSRKSGNRAVRAVRQLQSFFGLYRALDISTDKITEYIAKRLEDDINHPPRESVIVVEGKCD